MFLIKTCFYWRFNNLLTYLIYKFFKIKEKYLQLNKSFTDSITMLYYLLFNLFIIILICFQVTDKNIHGKRNFA